jgi:hypothetical protein
MSKDELLKEWEGKMYDACPQPELGNVVTIAWNNEKRSYIFFGYNYKWDKFWVRFDPEEHSHLVTKPSDLTLERVLGTIELKAFHKGERSSSSAVQDFFDELKSINSLKEYPEIQRLLLERHSRFVAKDGVVDVPELETLLGELILKDISEKTKTSKS